MIPPPRIVTARSMGLQFRTNQLSPMGPEKGTVGHYSVGARAKTLKEGIARVKAIHAQHLDQRWAGFGYHFAVDDLGDILCGRSTFHIGSHVLRKNDSRIGVVMLGNVGDRPTRLQSQTFYWLLHNAHTAEMPRVHRTDRDLSRLPRTVHGDLMATACPGLFRGMLLKGGEPFVEPSAGTLEPIEDGFVDMSPEDEEVLAAINEGKLPDLEAEAATLGPDEQEVAAASNTDEVLELPEADEDFDEDLTELLDEIEREQTQPLS